MHVMQFTLIIDMAIVLWLMFACMIHHIYNINSYTFQIGFVPLVGNHLTSISCIYVHSVSVVGGKEMNIQTTGSDRKHNGNRRTITMETIHQYTTWH